MHVALHQMLRLLGAQRRLERAAAVLVLIPAQELMHHHGMLLGTAWPVQDSVLGTSPPQVP